MCKYYKERKHTYLGSHSKLNLLIVLTLKKCYFKWENLSSVSIELPNFILLLEDFLRKVHYCIIYMYEETTLDWCRVISMSYMLLTENNQIVMEHLQKIWHVHMDVHIFEANIL